MRLHVALVAATVAALSATLPLSRLSGNYPEPPHFALFQKLTYVQQGLVGGILLSGLGWLCLRLGLRPWLSFALHTAYFAYFGWLSAWALTRKLFGLDLSPLYLYGFLTEPGTLAGVGFRPGAFFSVLAAAVVLVAGLGALGAASLVNGGRRVVAQLALAQLVVLVLVNVPARAYLTREIDRGQYAALAFDDAMPFPLRSERLVPGWRRPRLELPSLEAPDRVAPYAAALRAATTLRIPRPRDIVWLFVECLRADAISPDATPYLWSQRERFEIRLDREHWSGGNSTPYALFSMLSGLGAWQLRTFQDQRLTFPFLDLLRANGYRLRAGKSVTFDYHGIRQLLPPDTILPVVQRRPLDAADLEMLARYFADRETRPPGPSFDVLSFDATHWHYFFPDEDAVFRPFATPDRRVYLDRSPDQLAGIRNRYANACHFVDRQVRRVIEDLDRRGVFEDTLVVLVGDHGEELGEHGQMTHSGALNEVQGRSPLWIHVPGRPAPVASPDTPTSHVDIVATLLDGLGFDADVLYTQGRSLLERKGERTTLVLAEQGYLEPSYHAFVTPRTISRWRYVGGRFLFASVQPRDGTWPAGDPWGTPDAAWLAELRGEVARAALLYQVLPDVSRPPRRFSRP